MITHLTASSNKSLSASSPYINSAIYFIGPTSASSFLYSASIAYFSSVRVSISLFAFFIFNKFSSISSVLLSGVILPISDRNLFITLFESAISCSAILRSLLISSCICCFFDSSRVDTLCNCFFAF